MMPKKFAFDAVLCFHLYFFSSLLPFFHSLFRSLSLSLFSLSDNGALEYEVGTMPSANAPLLRTLRFLFYFIFFYSYLRPFFPFFFNASSFFFCVFLEFGAGDPSLEIAEKSPGVVSSIRLWSRFDGLLSVVDVSLDVFLGSTMFLLGFT